jgi:hypothetical protein
MQKHAIAEQAGKFLQHLAEHLSTRCRLLNANIKMKLEISFRLSEHGNHGEPAPELGRNHLMCD